MRMCVHTPVVNLSSKILRTYQDLHWDHFNAGIFNFWSSPQALLKLWDQTLCQTLTLSDTPCMTLWQIETWSDFFLILPVDDGVRSINEWLGSAFNLVVTHFLNLMTLSLNGVWNIILMNSFHNIWCYETPFLIVL